MKIDMDFIKKEIENQVEDKLDNMCYSEITEELYEYLENKTDMICKSVYEVLNNNECVIDDGYTCLNARDGFSKDLIANWDIIESMDEADQEKEIQSTILYNYDALWMTAIHKAFPDNTTCTQCGWGEMELIQ